MPLPKRLAIRDWTPGYDLWSFGVMELKHHKDMKHRILSWWLHCRSSQDEEEADESVERVPMTLAEARKASEALRNQ